MSATRSLSTQIKVPVSTASKTASNVWTVTIDGVFEIYEGLAISIITPEASNGSATTLNVNGLGAKSVVMLDQSSVPVNVTANQILSLTFINSKFVIQNVYPVFIPIVESFVATAGQTAITLQHNYDVGTNAISVHINGNYQQAGSGAYTESGSNSITLSEALKAGDLVEVKINYKNPGFVFGAPAVSYLAAGTGAVSRTLDKKLGDVVSVKDFGAVGDGNNDDTVAIQNAINYISGSYKGVVIIPAGTYIISSPGLKVPSNVSLKGYGKAVSIITNSNTCSLIGVQGSVATGVVIEGIQFKMNFQYDKAVDLTSITRSRVSDCMMTRGPSSGYYGYGVYGDSTNSPGYDNQIMNNEFVDCYLGIYLGNNANAYKIFCNTFDSCQSAIYVDQNVWAARIISNRLENTPNDFIHINGIDCTVYFNYMESYSSANGTPTTGYFFYVGANAQNTDIGPNYASPVTGTLYGNYGANTSFVDNNHNRSFGGTVSSNGLGGNVVGFSANTTLTKNNALVTANGATAAFTITLPPANALAGQKLRIVKTDSSANAVTVAVQGSDKINGASSYALSAQYKYVSLESDGSNSWYIVGSN